MISPTSLVADVVTPQRWILDEQNLRQPNAGDILFPSNHPTGYCEKKISSDGLPYYDCKEDPAREPAARTMDRQISEFQQTLMGGAVGVTLLSFGLLFWIGGILAIGAGLAFVPRAFLWPVRVIGEQFRADSNCAIKPLWRTSARVCVD